MKSFLAQLESHFLAYKRLTMLQISLSEQSFKGLVISNQKGKLTVDYFFNGLNEIEESDKISVVALFRGKGILNKKVSVTQVHEDDFFEREFPNIQQNDFLIEVQEAEQSAMVSLCRKNIVYSKVSDLKEQNIDVLDVFINPMHFIPLALLVQEAQLIVDGNTVLIKDNSFVDFLAETDQVEVKQVVENVPNKLLLLYSVALSKVLKLDQTFRIGFSDFTRKEEDFLYKKVLSLSYKIVPGILFLVLMINLFIFQSLFSKKSNLDNSIGYYRNISAENQQLVEEIDKKTNFLAHSGWDQKSKISKVLDQVALNIPDEIQLHQWNYFPLDEKEYNDQEVFVFDNNRILIKGTTGKVKYLNNWVSLLKKEEWFTEVEILDYSFNKEENIGEFILEARFE